MTLENPIRFISERIVNGMTVKYQNLTEIVQGGPEIGQLLIGDNVIKSIFLEGLF